MNKIDTADGYQELVAFVAESSNNTEKILNIDELPKLLPQQMAMLNYIYEGDNYIDAYRKAGYKAIHAMQSAFCLINRNPLKAHLENYYRLIAKAITPEYITSRLNDIVNLTTNINTPAGFNPDTAIKAMQEINKMMGNHKQHAIHINNVHATVEDIRNAKREYLKDS